MAIGTSRGTQIERQGMICESLEEKRRPRSVLEEVFTGWQEDAVDVDRGYKSDSMLGDASP